MILANGTFEALKWLAAVVMVLDHTNKFFFAESMGIIFAAGRLVMPVFGFVLAYILARPEALARGVHRRMLVRRGFIALIATPIVIALNHSVVEHNAWWPLNILFTLGWSSQWSRSSNRVGGQGICSPRSCSFSPVR